MSALPFVGDVLTVAALVLMTIGVYGIFRLPDVHTQLHAASKTVVLGVIALLAASVATREAEIVARAAIVAAALLITTPAAAHAIARAAYRTRQPMVAPDSVDESGRLPVRAAETNGAARANER